MEHAVQLFAAVSFLVIGLSHVFKPRAWIAYFQLLASHGTSGAFVDGFLCLNFGGIIVGFHHVWHGPAIVLTIVGWSQVLKGVVRFVAPEVSVRLFERMTAERAWQIRVGGVFALVLSGFFAWLRFGGPGGGQ